ncbi:MAG: hypothetical protein ABI196_03655 [Bradyrhizobium sp.]
MLVHGVARDLQHAEHRNLGKVYPVMAPVENKNEARASALRHGRGRLSIPDPFSQHQI